MATQIDLGAVVPIGKGDWNSITTYERANIVRHNSTAWMCKVATSMGVEPTEDSTDWYLLVKDTSSVTSVNGMRGDVIVDTSTADKLSTARKITLTGPVTGTANFDGSANVSISTNIVEASTSIKGVVQLSSDVNSTSTTTAATSGVVKTAYDKAVEANTKATEAKTLADAALPKTGGKIVGALQEHVISLEGTSVNIDLTTSNNFAHVVTEATTFTITAKDDYGFQLGTLVLSNGGAFTVTWPSNFKWSDGTPPSLMANGIDIITFFTIDKGVTYYAAQIMTGIV